MSTPLRSARCLLVLIACLLPTSALADFPALGQVYQSFAVDLNRDGKSEKIELRAHFVDEDSYAAQLSVRDAAGKLLWQGPKAQPRSPFAAAQPVFGSWPYGNSGISLVTDLDGDGSIELLSDQPVSDVRPVSWRVFRWTGKAFAYVHTRRLLEKKPGSGQFIWQPAQQEGNTWIAAIQAQGQELRAEIWVNQPNGEVWTGQAAVVKRPSGFQVSRWLKKPAKSW